MMVSRKKLSIITICYNEPNLEKTCESIVNQTWQNFEWIVVDGGSNEHIQKIWDKYKYRIDKFISEPDKGIYDAYNKGLKFVNGEYINFLNAGDYYSSNTVLAEIFNEPLEQDVVYGNLNVLINDEYIEKIYPDVITKEYLLEDSLPHPASFIKKEFFEKYGNYDMEYKIVSDWKKWLDFFVLNQCSYKHKNVIVANFNLNGISSSNIELVNKERDDVLKQYSLKKKTSKKQLLKNIFSITNSNNKKHKIITILGIRMKRRIK